MADGNVVADYCFRFLISTVNNHTILDIHFISDPYAVYVSPDNSVEPDAAVFSHHDVPDDSGIGRDVYIFTEFWRYTFNGKNDGHMVDFTIGQIYMKA